jgi:hypothetical protein
MADLMGSLAAPRAEREEPAPAVRSRVNWGAIFGGAMVALALYFLLTLFGAAAGLSIGGRVRPETVGMAAALWAVLSTVLALFVGGYVTTQCSVGESRFEAVLYGVILWGVLFGMLLWLMASGVQAGFGAMVGMASANQNATEDFTARGWEWAARKAGVPEGKIQEMRNADGRGVAEDPEARRQTAEGAARVAWWSFSGTLLSMLAAVAGSYAGTGERFRMVPSPYVVTRGDGSKRNQTAAV